MPYLDKQLGTDPTRVLTMEEAHWALTILRFKILIEALQIFYRKNLERTNVKSPTVH